MSACTDSDELLEMVPDQTLSSGNEVLLAERLSDLLALDAVTRIARAEARCISSLLATGSINNRRVLRLILRSTPLGEEFKMSGAPAAIANPIIQMQHEIWDNLTAMVRDGKMLKPPVDITDGMEDRDQQRALAYSWWTGAATILQAVHGLDVLPWGDIREQLPPFVETKLAKEQFDGAYLLGYTLYLQQAGTGGVYLSTDPNALVMMADTMASAVIAAHEKVRDHKTSGKMKLLDRCATHLAYHLAELRGFVVAALDDPDMWLQRGLINDAAVLGCIQMALQTVNDTPGTIDWEGSRANMLNMQVRSKTKGSLDQAFADSVQKAAGSPLNQTPR